MVAEAIALAGISADSITYVEAHGTATPVGDPIEVAALTEAFRRSSERCGYCALGSVKSNLGHLDAAAGVAGLIKTVLMLEYREIPATLHFRRPNPRIDFTPSPFFVTSELQPWSGGITPRRAGVSSFGIGGGNAHVVLQEAEANLPGSGARALHLLVVSARSEAAREEAVLRLTDAMRGKTGEALADAAYTLQTGRRPFAHRWALVVDAAGRPCGDPLRGHAEERSLELNAENVASLLELAQLWVTGAEVRWKGLYRGQRRKRVPLPSYPFERRRHWLEAPEPVPVRRALDKWFYVPSWKRSVPILPDRRCQKRPTAVADFRGWRRIGRRGRADPEARGGASDACSGGRRIRPAEPGVLASARGRSERPRSPHPAHASGRAARLRPRRCSGT